MIKNNHGFTLIESVVTLAILTIASTMIILGLFNIINLFSEGSMIKTETNTLYTNVIQNIGKNLSDYSQEIKLNNGSTNLTIPVGINSDEVDNPFKIKLRYFDPQYKADILPGETPTNPETPNLSATIYFLNSSAAANKSDMFSRISVDMKQFSEFDAGCYSLIGTQENCIESDVINGTYSGSGLKELIATPPSQTIIDNAYATLSQEYKEFLGSSYEVRYMALTRQLATGGYNNSKVYCYLVPKQKGVYVSWWVSEGTIQSEAIWCPVSSTTNKIDLSMIPAYVKKLFTVGTDGETRVEYTIGQLQNLNFFGDFPSNQTFFAFSSR